MLTMITEFGLAVVKPVLSWIQVHSGRRALEFPKWLRDRAAQIEDMKQRSRLYFPEAYALANASVQRKYRFGIIPFILEYD